MIKELENKRYLIEYLRDSNKKTYGVMLAYLDEASHTVKMGWSKLGYSEKANKYKDFWNREKGLFIALKRAESSGLKKLPKRDFEGRIENFVKNVEEYFTPRPVEMPRLDKEITFKETLG